jgi:hypothetical protein
MKVFISWSGEPSKSIALALRDWLPMVIQAVEPYMSELDTHAGERWLQKVSTELDETNFSIICVTRENVKSQWLNFEAGALSKVVDTARVVPLLHGFSSTSDLAPPLGQFQAKLANEKGIKELLTAIDSHTEHPLGQVTLAKIFARFWPDLEEQVDEIPKTEIVALDEPERTDRELLEELLQLVRMNTAADADRRRGRLQFIQELHRHFGSAVHYASRSDTMHIRKSTADISESLLGYLYSTADKLGLQLQFSEGELPPSPE